MTIVINRYTLHNSGAMPASLFGVGAGLVAVINYVSIAHTLQDLCSRRARTLPD